MIISKIKLSLDKLDLNIATKICFADIYILQYDMTRH